MVNRLLHDGKAMVLADQVVVSGGGMLTQLLVAKGLGLEIYGRFSAIMLVQLFLLSLFQAGLSGMYMVVWPALGRRGRAVYTAGVLGSMGPVALVIMIAGILAYPLLGVQYGLATYAMAALGMFFALLQDLYRKMFLTTGDQSGALIAGLLNSAGQVLGIALPMYAGSLSLSLVIAVCTLSFLPALVYAAVRCGVRPSFRGTGLVLHHNGLQALWLTGSALLQWFAGNIYVMAGAWWLGPAALGILRLGQYVFGLFNVMLQAVENYLVPQVSAFSAHPSHALRRLRSVQRRMVLCAVVALAVCALMAKPVLVQLAVPYIQEVLTVIYGMSTVYVLVVAGYPVRVALRSLKHGSEFFKGYLINAVIGGSTAYLFIHNWGVAGVVAGLFISQLVLLVYWAGVLQKKYRVIWK